MAKTKFPMGGVAASKRTGRSIKPGAGRSGPLRALVETYNAAVKRSRLTGHSVSFVVAVDPQGRPKFRIIKTTLRKPAPRATGEHADDLQTALAAARERGRARVADVLGGADMLSAEQFAARIGTSRVTVNEKRKNHQVLGLEGASRGFRYPDWQIGDDGRPFAMLPELFDRLGDSPWAVYRLLVQHHPELDGMTGREALYRGRAAEVLDVAESVMRAAG